MFRRQRGIFLAKFWRLDSGRSSPRLIETTFNHPIDRIPIMKAKSILVTVLLVGCALAVYAAAASPVKPQVRQNVSQSNTWQYAQLVIISEDEFQFLVGGNAPIRTRSTRALLGDLGSSQKPTLANLLDQIGSKGWELVAMNDTSWTFKRAR